MEKNAQEKIEERRLIKLKWLKDCLTQVIKASEQTLTKIESEGLRGHYSCNHDVQRWAERVHSASYELWLLRDISETLSKESQKSDKKETSAKSKKSSKAKKDEQT